MADIKHAEITIEVNAKLTSTVAYLLKYKSAADEALSYCLETSTDKHAKKLLLNALNIGAHGGKEISIDYQCQSCKDTGRVEYPCPNCRPLTKGCSLK